MIRENDYEPNVWVEIGNGYSACIKAGSDGTWEVWVTDDASGGGWRSAWNLPSEEEALRNLTEVVMTTYGDERIFGHDASQPAPAIPLADIVAMLEGMKVKPTFARDRRRNAVIDEAIANAKALGEGRAG